MVIRIAIFFLNYGIYLVRQCYSIVFESRCYSIKCLNEYLTVLEKAITKHFSDSHMILKTVYRTFTIFM